MEKRKRSLRVGKGQKGKSGPFRLFSVLNSPLMISSVFISPAIAKDFQKALPVL